MHSRLRLVMAAAVFLYLGPLLGGMIGMGWEAVPVFVALFTLWMVVMRPSQWPRNLSGWSADTLSGAMLQVMVSVVIVLVLFAIGRGIATLAGLNLALSPYIPIGLAFLATPLSRAVWNPEKGEAMDKFLTEAIEQIESTSPTKDEGVAGDVMTRTLLALPDDADPILTSEAIDAAVRGVEGSTRLCDLEMELDWQDPPRRGLRHGLILWATNPERAKSNIHSAQMTAFNVAGSDDDLLRLFAERGYELLQIDGTMWVNFPPAGDLEMVISSAHSNETQLGLKTLAAELRYHSPDAAAAQ